MKSTEELVVVPLLEGVYSSSDALGLKSMTVIDGIECRVLLPEPIPPDWTERSGSLVPPNFGLNESGPQWPMNADWGYFDRSVPDSVIVNAVGLVPGGEWGYESRDADVPGFDYAVGLWRHLLRDWLSVFADGPTTFHEPPVKGETWWASTAYNQEVQAVYWLNVRRPQRVSRWQWEHVLAHTLAAEQPPLARVLLTTAKRAAATANPRLAVIDAATAAEVALTAGMTSRLSRDASVEISRALIDRTKMLGPRLDLARDLGMALPDRVRPDLLERRNAVVHRGIAVTGADAEASIAAAAELIETYEPLDAHCRQPLG